MANERKKVRPESERELPVTREEDVEFSLEEADDLDLEAAELAADAVERQSCD